MKHRKLRDIPIFTLLKENNVRKGFLSEADHDRLAAACLKEGAWLRAALEIGAAYGWRSSEIKNLKVGQLDLVGEGTLLLNPGETKNGKGRIVPLLPHLRVLLTPFVLRKKATDYLLTQEDGRPLGDIRGPWNRAVAAAGLGAFHCRVCDTVLGVGYFCEKCQRRWRYNDRKWRGLLFHDLRRSAVRSMRRYGMSETEAMLVTGHKTRSMLDRYSIIDEGDLRETFARVEKLREAERELIALQEAQRAREAAASLQVGYNSASEARPN